MNDLCLPQSSAVLKLCDLDNDIIIQAFSELQNLTLPDFNDSLEQSGLKQNLAKSKELYYSTTDCAKSAEVVKCISAVMFFMTIALFQHKNKKNYKELMKKMRKTKTDSQISKIKRLGYRMYTLMLHVGFGALSFLPSVSANQLCRCYKADFHAVLEGLKEAKKNNPYTWSRLKYGCYNDAFLAKFEKYFDSAKIEMECINYKTH